MTNAVFATGSCWPTFGRRRADSASPSLIAAHLRYACARLMPIDATPLKPSGAGPSNLPIPSTSFVGRDRETENIIQLLASTRLLTLTGGGGAGKSRLALRV